MIELGRLVEQAIPGSKLEQVSINEDERNYRVSFDKISNLLGYKTEKTVLDGIKEIADSLRNGEIKNYKDAKYYNVNLKEYK
jgi:nucleoside-diphosphate-sugar epimerase